MAENTSTPSRPRLMRPDFSVMHSARLTIRNGVPTRTAPPSTAISRLRKSSLLVMAGSLSDDGLGRRSGQRHRRQRRSRLQQPPAQRLAGEDEEEGEAL